MSPMAATLKPFNVGGQFGSVIVSACRTRRLGSIRRDQTANATTSSKGTAIMIRNRFLNIALICCLVGATSSTLTSHDAHADPPATEALNKKKMSATDERG